MIDAFDNQRPLFYFDFHLSLYGCPIAKFNKSLSLGCLFNSSSWSSSPASVLSSDLRLVEDSSSVEDTEHACYTEGSDSEHGTSVAGLVMLKSVPVVQGDPYISDVCFVNGVFWTNKSTVWSSVQVN